MSDDTTCPYCGKVCKTTGGLRQHISKNSDCKYQQRLQVSVAASVPLPSNQEAQKAQIHEQPSTTIRRSARLQIRDHEAGGSVRFAVESAAESPTDPGAFLPDPQDVNIDLGGYEPDSEANANDDGSTNYGVEVDDDSISEDEEEDDEDKKKAPPNTQMLTEFRAFCDTHSHNFVQLSREDVTSIKLLNALKSQKAPLRAYPSLLEWHLKETQHLREHESLKDTPKYFHRETLMKKLIERYNMKAMLPKIKRLRLPHSKAVVHVPYRDVKDCIVSLLTDPRVRNKDYLFFNKDPTAKPPEKVTFIEDINTGEAFLASHRKYCTQPNQVPLGIIFYIDGAVTGQFSDLPITALKISLSIHNREARDHEWAWREIAWIPQVRKQQARGKKLVQESNHLESLDLELLDGEGDYAESDDEDGHTTDEDTEPAVKAQDFHTMLSFALKSLVDLQERGFIWDTAAYGNLFRGLEFVPFVLNVKCDTEEGDLLCGKYLVRTQNVANICRYCVCPTANADNPNAEYRFKTPKMIQKLIDKGDLEGLQQISQQNIKNAWYPLRFHAANDRGIHGACPSEMLHAILLGIFKYVRNIFFIYIGEESKLAEDINGLASVYGKYLKHQSDRDLPDTHFAKGIQKGKLMAKQYRGVLLLIAVVIRSSLGRKLLMVRKKFKKENGLRDWTLLVELLLEWEAYLCEKRMKRSHVTRLAKKHRYIMYIMLNVAKRSEGMGLKLMKFHAIVHMVEDILLYGVPSEFDTGSNESHHKPAKYAAKLTQRKEATFNYQTAKRMTEFMVLDLAINEVNGGKVVWEYFQAQPDSDDSWTDSSAESPIEEFLDPDPEPMDISLDQATESGRSSHGSGQSQSDSTESSLPIWTGGTRIEVYEDEDDNNEPSFCVHGSSKHKEKTKWSEEIVVFLVELQKLVLKRIVHKELPIFTEHKRGDIIFRGHPNYHGEGPWRDWVLIDWGRGWGTLPSHIWCFVDLTGFKSGSKSVEYGGIRLEKNVYAVVEVGQYVQIGDEALQSDLLVPLHKEVQGIDEIAREVNGRKLYLAPTGAFVGPCVVIPDIGGSPNAYFEVKPRRKWANEFVDWLKSSHLDDTMEFSEAEQVEKQSKKSAKST